MTSNEGYALLIGVDDYSAYDATAGNPKGTSSLLGSRNDVLAFWRTCRDLDIAPANIRVLTSPRLDPATLPGALPENVGEASEQAILKGAAWLADAIGGTGAPGLLTFSGHGDQTERGGLAICPSDIVGPNVDGAISFEALRGLFAKRNALGSLTCVIDACFAGAANATLGAPAAKERRVLSLTNRAAPTQRTPKVAREGHGRAAGGGLVDRMIAAARADQPAFQASFSGEYRGAFSWAVGAALDQWNKVREGGSTRLNLSYGELRDRAERLLGSLSFEQTPVLHGPDNVADLAFFQRGSVPQQTSREPDAPRLRMQVDPGMLNFRKYVLTQNTNPTAVLTEVFAIAVTSGSYNAGTEYWNANIDALANLGSASVSIAYTDYSSGTPSPTSFTHTQTFEEPIVLTWVTMGDDPVSGGTLLQNGSIYVRLNRNANNKIVTVTWYHVLPTGETPANVVPNGTYSVASSVSVARNYTAHYVTYAVT